MDVLGLVLAVAALVAAGVIWRRSQQAAEAAAEREQELRRRLGRSEQRSTELAGDVREADEREQRLEAELAEAVARRDEKAMAATMWQLELQRADRQWRDVVVPGATSEHPNEADGVNDGSPDASQTGRQLAEAIGHEVERLREEVGVAIRFDGDLDFPLAPETALGTLRVAEELLAAAAKAADEVAVSLDEGDEPSISLVLRCVGWEDLSTSLGAPGSEDGGPLVGPSVRTATNVAAMVDRLDGWVRWHRAGEDEVTISVRIPISDVVDVIDLRDPAPVGRSPGAPHS